jgi:hypothetical protein
MFKGLEGSRVAMVADGLPFWLVLPVNVGS